MSDFPYLTVTAAVPLGGAVLAALTPRRTPERAKQIGLLTTLVTLGFAMPGHAIACYDDMSEVVRRAGIFCARQYQEIVEELLEFWKIGLLTGLSAAGREAQDKLMKVPTRLARMADFQNAKSVRRDYGFDFIGNRIINI